MRKSRPPHRKNKPYTDREVVRLRRWRRGMDRLLEAMREMSVEKDVNRILSLVIDATCRVLRAERATVFLLDKEKNELWAPVATGRAVLRFPADKGVAGRAVTLKRIVNVDNAYDDGGFFPGADRTTGFLTRNILTVPMARKGGDIIGAVQALNKKRGRFTRDDENRMVLLAGQAAAAVANALHFDELQTAYRDTLFRLAAAAEYKDQDTRNHLERVSRYCVIMARALGRDEDWCERLGLASSMHDIGKLGVSDAVLKKPGKLDAFEWVEMRRHPTVGADILANSTNDLLRMSERVARCHHEKWDGTGYPSGLAGEAIPIEARLVAVADVFDALTSRRCYKPAMTAEEALGVIRKGAGNHFDPSVVEAFFRAQDKILGVMDQFADVPATRMPPIAKETPEKPGSAV